MIFCGNILGTLKLISAFLSGCLLAYSLKHGFLKISVSVYLLISNFYVSQPRFCVLSIEYLAILPDSVFVPTWYLDGIEEI